MLGELETVTTGSESAAPQEPAQGVDPGSLPPELEPVYKGLEATFTKKFQALAEERKQHEGAIEKATALDRIISDPEYRRVFLASLQAQSGEMPQGKQEPEEWRSTKPEEFFDDNTMKNLRAFQMQGLEQVLSPIVQQFTAYKQKIDEFFARQGASEFDQVVAKYENGNEFKAQAEQIRRAAPNLSWEQALHAAAAGKLKAPSKAESKVETDEQPQEDRRQQTLFNAAQSAAVNGRPRPQKVDLSRLAHAAWKKSGVQF